MDVRSTDRTDLTAKRIEQIAQPAGKTGGDASRRRQKKEDKNERYRDEQMDAVMPLDGSHILDVKV